MSDASSSATALPALDNTMGMLYLSALFAMGLWGAGTVQMYFYYTTYPADSLWLKYLVAVTWCADTANQGLISQLVYTYLVTNFANPAYLSALQPTLLPMMFLTGIIALLAQTFFCWRIWRLSNGNIWLTGGTYIVCFASFVSTMVFYGMTADYNEFAQLIPLHPYMHALNVLSAASDVIIAIVLVHLLRKQRTGYRKTNSMINRLILFTLNTGGICGLCAILTLVFNIVYPDTYIYMLFYIIVCRVYLNSLLATLNSRETIRAIGNATIINSMPNFSNQDSISLAFVGANGHPELGLRSSGTTENDRDSKTVGGVRPVSFAYHVNLTVYGRRSVG
ncbi:hypothetical protein EV421DRAFT_652306 [Armillaria borealis]|uniref:DUF6534 domain-containing protein n=1 Tax=Armillaria borealis TaxID=47425 RepID=A0AA39K484_9AGAR|nr:hypothetical protein EV421DRAFT_652306 [Armillaria borealis]